MRGTDQPDTVFPLLELICGAKMAKITGTNKANKSLYGTQRSDDIFGLDGNDYLNGQRGNDRLDGGRGDDKVDGGAGNDTVRGGAGKDFVIGNHGNDLLYGDAGNDYLFGGRDFDRLWGGDGDDRLVGGDGTAAGDGSNDLYGGAGNDTMVLSLYGTIKAAQNSHIDGGGGTDTLHIVAPGKIQDAEGAGDAVAATISAAFGTTGLAKVWAIDDPTETSLGYEMGTVTGIERITIGANTRLDYGGSNADTTVEVVGGNDSDVFWLGDGNEIITGGAARDYFLIDADRAGTDGNLGRDVITDFDANVDQFRVLDMPPEEGFFFKQREEQFDGKGGIDTVVNVFAPDGHQIQELALLNVTGLPNIHTIANDWWG